MWGKGKKRAWSQLPWILRLLHLDKRGHAPGPCSLTFQHFCAGLCRPGNSDPESQLEAQPSRCPALSQPHPHARACRRRPGHTLGLSQQLLSLQVSLLTPLPGSPLPAGACFPSLQGRGSGREPGGLGAGVIL